MWQFQWLELNVNEMLNFTILSYDIIPHLIMQNISLEICFLFFKGLLNILECSELQQQSSTTERSSSIIHNMNLSDINPYINWEQGSSSFFYYILNWQSFIGNLIIFFFEALWVKVKHNFNHGLFVFQVVLHNNL